MHQQNGGKYDYITNSLLLATLHILEICKLLREISKVADLQLEDFGGGASPGGYIDEIDYLTIASAGNGVDFGNFNTTQKGHNSGLSNSTRGILGGGYGPSLTNIIEYVEINTMEMH